jgi:hypothetical protein
MAPRSQQVKVGGVSTFKRATLEGSEELFRPTRPVLVEADVISEVIDRPAPAPTTRPVSLSEDEVGLLLDAIQAAKYPEQRRAKPSLDRFERLDDLKAKLQDVYSD